MGIKKKQIPWNKGLTKETDERVNYYRPTAFKKGQRTSSKTEFKKGCSGFNRKHSGESKKKMSDSHKGQIPWNKGMKFKEWYNTHGYKFKIIDCKRIFEHISNWITQSGWGFIPNGFVVHHINGVRDDNRIENLSCIPRGVHTALHNQMGLLLNPERKYWGINLRGDKN